MAMAIKWVIILLCCIKPIVAWAMFPEYEHISQGEIDELHTPRLIDSEYQSDKLVYEMPISWYQPWLSQNKVFQYTAGSLGPTRFLTRGRLKVRQNLTERLFFQLAWVDRGGFEMARNNLIFEFGYFLFPGISLNLYGQSQALKREDDIGLASEIHFSSQSYLRLFHSWLDFSHNKRNEGSDRYSQGPRSYGLVWRQFDELGQFHQVSLRHDTKAVLNFDNPTRLYGNQGLFLESVNRFRLSDVGDYLQLKLEGARMHEQDSLATDGNVDTWELDRLSLWIQQENLNAWIPLYGIKVIHYHWQSQEGHVIHNNILPHLWWQIFESRSEGLSHFGRLGYEMTWHRGRGPVGLRGINDFNDRDEHRMNFRYQVDFKSFGQMIFLLSIDLDALETAPWEGGNIQYSMSF